MSFEKFPSIDQYRHALQQIQRASEHTGEYTRTFYGTVKLHGTNAAIGVSSKGKVWFQSRNRLLTVEDDNMQFAATMSDPIMQRNAAMFAALIRSDKPLKATEIDDRSIVFYGEWCGKGIQSGVGVSQLEKRFVLFDIKIGDEWLTTEELRTYAQFALKLDVPFDFIHHYDSWWIEVDCRKPDEALEFLKGITAEVEEVCPYAKANGAEGIGEGVVWRSDPDEYDGVPQRFKTKGDKHSTSKVKTISAVDMKDQAKLNELATQLITPRRLEQGMEYLREMGLFESRKSTGDFLRWVVNDVHKEEGDLIQESGIDEKRLNKALSYRARVWFFEKVG